MVPTSRILRSLLVVLLTIATTAAADDVLTLTAVPVQQQPLKEGDVVLEDLIVGNLLVAPNAGCSEVEPNNNAAQATPLTLPAECTGAAASGDPGDYIVTYTGGATDDIEDVWRVVLGSPGAITVTATFNASGDIDIFLFTVSGSTLTPLANSSKTGTTSETFTSTRTAGTYYVGVSAYSGSSAYTLNVSATGQGTVTVNAPSNLQAQAMPGGIIHLTWNDNSNNEDEFRVEQHSGVSWVDIGGTAANATGVNVTGFSAGETGRFRVRARAGATYSSYSNEASATVGGGCTPDPTTVCLLYNRFRVRIDYVNPFSNPPNQPGTFLAAHLLTSPENPDTALFGFSSADAVEVVVRVQDTRPYANRFDIYFGGMTDVAYTVHVTDTQTGTTRDYTNVAGHVGGGVDRTSFPAN